MIKIEMKLRSNGRIGRIGVTVPKHAVLAFEIGSEIVTMEMKKTKILPVILSRVVSHQNI